MATASSVHQLGGAKDGPKRIRGTGEPSLSDSSKVVFILQMKKRCFYCNTSAGGEETLASDLLIEKFRLDR
jgi:hypothetical protein